WHPARAAAAWGGPKVRIPAASSRSTRPATRGCSGPTTTKSMPRSVARRSMPSTSPAATATHSASAAIPALPGAAMSRSHRGEAAIAHASACSRPPDPTTRTRIPRSFRRRSTCSCRPPRLAYRLRPSMARSPLILPGAPPASNLPEFTVSEIAGAIKRTLEGRFDRIRVRGEISSFKRHGSGHLYLCLKDTDAVLEAVIWRSTATRLVVKPEDGLEVVATGRLTTHPGRSKYPVVIDPFEVGG